MKTLNSIIYICTSTLHSFLSLTPSLHSHSFPTQASTVISFRPKTTYTASIQPYTVYPDPPSPTSAINTLLAIQYSSILVPCPNHPNSLTHCTRQLPLYSSCLLIKGVRNAYTPLSMRTLLKVYEVKYHENSKKITF